MLFQMKKLFEKKIKLNVKTKVLNLKDTIDNIKNILFREKIKCQLEEKKTIILIYQSKAASCWIICCYKKVGKLLYISGQISIDNNGNLIKGKIGKDLNVEDGYEAAKRCALNIVSQAKKACDMILSKLNHV